MRGVPDNEMRLRLRVALKLMGTVGVLVLASVAVGYLAGGGRAESPGVMRIPVAGLAAGEARTVLWAGRPVIVLHRDRDTRRALAAGRGADTEARWFVAFAADTERGCPVRWRPQAREFRSSCGDARYDAAGRPLAGTAGAPLAVPPHRVTGDGVLVLESG